MRLALATVAILLALVAPAHAGRWVAGDLHVHTCFSHDVWCGPDDDNTPQEDFYTYGRSVDQTFAIARSRGLDYLAITDHNDVRSQSAPGFGGYGVVGIPAYENSIDGHAQMLGATRLYDNGDKSPAAVNAMADQLRADGGVFQANHPYDPRWGYGYDVPVDTIEVWNIPWYYQPPLPASTDREWALRWWESWLDRGFHVGVTGGSDSHWLSTTAAQGPGQPTTWIYVDSLTRDGVLRGLKAGHTFVSAEPPAYGGARIYLEADRDRNGTYETIAGDSVARGAAMRVRVDDAEGSYLSIVTDGGKPAFDPVLITRPRFEYSFRLTGNATWVHAEAYGEDKPGVRQAGCSAVFGADGSYPTTYCTNRMVMQALSSAIYLR
jgi:hypothetical protein